LIPGVQAANKVSVKVARGTTDVNFWVFVPRSYKKKQAWPLLLFLHGAGERGSKIEVVKKWGPPRLVGKDREFPFVVVSPQCPKRAGWDPKQLKQLVEHVTKSYKIDQSRMYCTGLSMGGYGTWSMVAEYPKLFAAAIPICGGGNPRLAGRMTRTPIWAFHGDADRVVAAKRSRVMVDAIKKAGGSAVKLTLYPGVNHNSWSRTYGNPKVYQWLLSHSLKSGK
jgi:predicted peptidase